MKVLYTTPSKSEADALVDYLAALGIDAAGVSRFDPATLVYSRYDVILRTGDDLKAARAAVDVFLASPAEVSEDLGESAVAELSGLDARLAPPCPACGELLPLDGSLRRCPSCDAEVDVGALVVSLHGPEVLVGDAAPPPCPRCGYTSEGLPRPDAGPPICPECGGPIMREPPA